MKKFILPAAFVATVLLSACGGDSKTDKNLKDSTDKIAANEALKPQYAKAITDAEAKLHQSPTLDPTLAMASIKAYNDYANAYPQDTLAPEYLFRASDLAQGTHNYKQATIFLEKIITAYPNYRRYPDACFVAAFIYDSYLEKQGGEDRAKELYQFIIQKNYPGYAEQAKTLIQYIGVSDSAMLNDIIKKGEAGNK